MKIFCTNDDGIYSPGLAFLAASLEKVGSGLQVGAPDREMSAVGTSLRYGLPLDGVTQDRHRGVRVRPHQFETHPHIEAHSVNATPAMIIFLAHYGVFGAVPDIVVSGPNNGVNLGGDVYHSGTVAAALTAVRHGVHGVAVSLERTSEDGRMHWETSAAVTVAVVEAMCELLAQEQTEHANFVPFLLNVNVPNKTLDEIAGFQVTELAGTSPFRWSNVATEHETDGSRLITWPPNADPVERAGEGTDIAAVRDGFVSLSWLSLIGTRDLYSGHALHGFPEKVTGFLGLA